MLSPSASTLPDARARILSDVWTGLGVISTVGAVGVVLMRKERDCMEVSPVGSVAVMIIPCTPALSEEEVKLMLPLESGGCVDMVPSMSETQDMDI